MIIYKGAILNLQGLNVCPNYLYYGQYVVKII